jgi:hypothetical protein
MPTSLLPFLAIAGALAADVQQDSSPAASAPGEIVVEGVRDQDKQIGDFVDALTKAPFMGQLSRFDWRVCPAAVGLSEVQNKAAAERMRKVAAAAGIPVGEADCRPNVLLLVARDKRAMIEGLKSKYPVYFEGMSSDEFKRMVRDPGPAAAWHVEGRLDADGVEVSRDGLYDYYVVERTDLASRLTTASRPHFLASIVVVDLDALGGLTVTQLADYAAMRAFARTDPARLGKTQAPTILTILDAPANSMVPITMTQWDFAFLKALYGTSPNRTAKSQRNEMKDLVRKELEDARDD